MVSWKKTIDHFGFKSKVPPKSPQDHSPNSMAAAKKEDGPDVVPDSTDALLSTAAVTQETSQQKGKSKNKFKRKFASFFGSGSSSTPTSGSSLPKSARIEATHQHQNNQQTQQTTTMAPFNPFQKKKTVEDVDMVDAQSPERDSESLLSLYAVLASTPTQMSHSYQPQGGAAKSSATSSSAVTGIALSYEASALTGQGVPPSKSKSLVKSAQNILLEKHKEMAKDTTFLTYDGFDSHRHRASLVDMENSNTEWEPIDMKRPLITELSSTPSPVQEEQAIRFFIGRIMAHKCPACDNKFMVNNSSMVFKHFWKIMCDAQDAQSIALLPWPPAPANSAAKCTNCSALSCPCCSKQMVSKDIPMTPFTAFGFGTDSWCCDGARLFYILALLCGPSAHPKDHLASILQNHQVDTGSARPPIHPEASASSSKPLRFKIPRPPAAKDNGTGYSKASFVGAMKHMVDDTVAQYKGTLPARFISNPVDVPFAKEIQQSLDTLPNTFIMLTKAWPSIQKHSSFDKNPPQLLVAIAARSPLMIKVAQLLHDDRIEEVMRRGFMYTAMFDFLRVVSAHPVTASLVHSERWDHPLSKTLLPVCFTPVSELSIEQSVAYHTEQNVNGKGKERAKTLIELQQPDSLQSLVSLFPALAIQAKSVMQYYDVKEKDADQTLAMCRIICDFAQEYRDHTGAARLPPSQDNSKVEDEDVVMTDAAPPDNRSAELRQWLSENKVGAMENKAWLDNYVYRNEMVKTSNQTPPPGRMKRLVYEISTLQTSLPEGIYVRHDSERLDVMKFLIAGPEGTPYENGLFEFHLFCPLEYPNKPPKVLLKSSPPDTGFNPNLYSNGKVCFSLLGTWSGEPWVSQQSTLLQLFVSLQAMIFCAEPLWNEPSFFPDRIPALESEIYNCSARSHTAKIGMTDWLVKREKTTPDAHAWDDVVEKHFELHWRTILVLVVDWRDNHVLASKSTLGMVRQDSRSTERLESAVSKLRAAFAKWDTGSAADQELLRG